MRALLRWLVALAVGLALCVGVGEAKGKKEATKRPQVTALVGWAVGSRGSGSFGVVGGPVAGKGWVGGEQARGLMRKGDRVLVYGLESGPVGTARLADNGTLASAGPPDGGTAEGLEYKLEVRAAPGTEKAWERDRLIATWHAGRSPEPRWVRAKVLSPKGRVYRDVVARWLRGRGVAEKAVAGVTLHQVVQADLNRDGRDEVLLSFYSADVYANLSAVPEAKPFSYLLMRYLPRGSHTPRTVVVEDAADTKREVIGLCDLDRDGWAEIVTEGLGLEQEDTCLCRWTGSGFRQTQGYSWGI